MMEFSLWKNLKKRLRRNRRPLWTLGTILIGLLIGPLVLGYGGETAAAASPDAKLNPVIQMLKQQNGPLSVKLRRIYVCGEELKPLGRMMSKQVAELVDVHPEWEVKLNEEKSEVFLEQYVDDLSEHCKENAYMGVNSSGHLTLYDGIPKKEKVVRTFFQLDVRYMESSLPQDKLDQLVKGIRISDIDEYNSVLSTYSDFAVEYNKNVMKRSY
ncbi:BofC C-terminal domain-containing protein [Paenibacillus sp. sgz302251]|uniref:BofC C-terminal domain-containing protein n=1 Tax=Paenibacillus sp. sgz302251 TaxID=3414493 RepID=UPI003C7DA643